MIQTLLEARNISFSYEGASRDTLSNINFKINKGEIVFITGASGSGKSTLLNIINGIIPEVVEGKLKGELFVNGKKILKIHERSLHLGNVFQNPRSQFFTTNTTSELVFEMENRAFPLDEMRKRLERVIKKFGIENLLNRDIFTLSSGERQLLALLTVLIMEPSILIFDEPSANLDYGNAMRLRKQLIDLKKEGKTILVADHRCYYLQGIIDKVLLMEDSTIKEFSSEREFCAYDYGKRVFDLFSHTFPEKEIIKSCARSVILSNVSYKDILKDLHVHFNRSEISAIVGVNGVGKSTLARLIAKIIKPDKGNIEINGRALYIMQDADFQLFGSSVLKELEITQKEYKKNMDALQLLNLWDLKDKHPQTLSGGEKQRLQMAISLVSKNDVIILDEPTSGLDKSSMNKVVQMLDTLKKDRTILLISHDYELIRRSADRVIYLKDSAIADEFYLEKENLQKLNNIFMEAEAHYEQ